VEVACAKMINHVQIVSGNNIQVQRMVVYFKLDKKYQLWLQFCTGLKVREKYSTLNPLKTKKAKQKQERAYSPLFMGVVSSNKVDKNHKSVIKRCRIKHNNDINKMS